MMHLSKLRKEYAFNILLFILIELILLIFFVTILIYSINHLSEGLLIITFGTLGFWYLTVYRIKEKYTKMINRGWYTITSIQHKINYPLYFSKKISFHPLIWRKGYYWNHQFIPKKFISFAEGKTLYPIREVDALAQTKYQILYVYKDKALIKDHHRKYLTHINNLEIYSKTS